MPGGPYDIACSALSIHHLAPEEKRLLFRRIFACLKPGGMFVNADQADGETPYFRQRYLEYWDAFLKSGPMTGAQHAEILKRRDTLDRNEKLSDQLAWLREAGFIRCRCGVPEPDVHCDRGKEGARILIIPNRRSVDGEAERTGNRPGLYRVKKFLHISPKPTPIYNPCSNGSLDKITRGTL